MNKIRSVLRVIFVVIIIFLIQFIFLPYRNIYLGDLIQRVTYDDGYEVSELSKEQMKTDLDYMLDCITSTTYYSDDMREVFGYTVEDKREHYYDLLDECENNGDFYILLSLILSECGSPHAGMTYCNASSYTGANTFNADILNLMPNNGGIGDGWYNYLSEYASEYYKRYYESDLSPVYVFCHYGSDYVSTIQQGLDYCCIIEINGSSPDEFINSHDFTFLMQYDFIENSLFRNYLYFLRNPASESSEEVEITVKYTDGTLETITCYYDFWETERYVLAEQYIGEVGYGFDVNEGTEAISEDEYIIEYEEETDTVYIKLPSFEYIDGETLKESISEYADSDNIIMDVRENPGGYVGFWENYVYPALYVAPLENTCNSYIEIGDFYMNIFYGFRVTCSDYDSIETLKASQLPISVNSSNKWYHLTQTQEAIGEYTGLNHDRDIAILTDSITCSCADDFVNYFKTSNLATIYGTNTCGEGTSITFAQWRLPESKLIFSCGYGIILNDEGKSSSIYGTSPDVYVPVDIDLFQQSRVSRDNGLSLYSIESMSQYDSVFIKAYNDIVNE
ncbi:MAG: hypothetical protein LIO69_07235 [Oscillospiraceae bacterium]|nr:hypothetical protein [Oscillospiraceae bacterium]